MESSEVVEATKLLPSTIQDYQKKKGDKVRALRALFICSTTTMRIVNILLIEFPDLNCGMCIVL